MGKISFILAIVLISSVVPLGIIIYNMQSNISDLEKNVSTLNEQLESLQRKHTALQDSYETLRNQYSTLQASYSALQADYEASEALRIGHLLADYYDEVDAKCRPRGFWWRLFGGGQQDQVNFAASLARHALAKVYWPELEDTYYNKAGEHSYITARRILEKVLEAARVTTQDPPIEKIRKILNFVSKYIHYEYDFNDRFLGAPETLGFRSGDCDDFAICVSALFELAGIDSAIGFFEGEPGYHAMVLVHNLPGLVPGVGSYSDLTAWNLPTGSWDVIEPQRPLERQDPGWLLQFHLDVAADV